MKILVPCALTGFSKMAIAPGPGWGHHHLDVQVGRRHVVQSIRGCAPLRELRAIETLHDDPLFMTCRLSIELLYSLLKSGVGAGRDASDLAWSVVHCKTCQCYVLPLDRMKSMCPCCTRLAARSDSEVWDRVMETAAKRRDQRRRIAMVPAFRRCPRTVIEALAA